MVFCACRGYFLVIYRVYTFDRAIYPLDVGCKLSEDKSRLLTLSKRKSAGLFVECESMMWELSSLTHGACEPRFGSNRTDKVITGVKPAWSGTCCLMSVRILSRFRNAFLGGPNSHLSFLPISIEIKSASSRSRAIS